MNEIKVIASSSRGNCYKYFNTIVDVGIPFIKLEGVLKHINLIILTHEHGDHLKIETIKNIYKNYKHIKFLIPNYLEHTLDFIESKRKIIIKYGEIIKFGTFSVRCYKLYHDVENCGYKLTFKLNEKYDKDTYTIFHATDTKHLQGISVKNCDYYGVECNYSDEYYNKIKSMYSTQVKDVPKELRDEEQNEIARKHWLLTRSENTHISDKQFIEFILKNAGNNSLFVAYHCSKYNLKTYDETIKYIEKELRSK